MGIFKINNTEKYLYEKEIKRLKKQLNDTSVLLEKEKKYRVEYENLVKDLTEKKKEYENLIEKSKLVLKDYHLLLDELKKNMDK